MKYTLIVLSMVSLFAFSQTKANSIYKFNSARLEHSFVISEDITNSFSDVAYTSELSIAKLKLNTPGEEIKRKKAAWLACCCGDIGLHRHYMGHIEARNMYILFCLFGPSFVIGWIDAYHYFKATDEEFVDKYLNNDKFIQWSKPKQGDE
jgi:hypothetical protein